MLEIKKLKVNFYPPAGTVEAVKGIDLVIPDNQIVGLVGESGSGKSVTAYSILKLIEHPGKIESGEILWQGKNLLQLSEDNLRKIRGKEIAMIFQDPFGSLNPVYTVGEQIAEVIRLHQGADKTTAYNQAIEMLKTVHIQDAEKRAAAYPHQLSGGMCQRAMIAMALACKPKLLIADEPTTALDVTIQAEILELLKEVQEKFNMAILLITHNLGIVANYCQKVYVMKEGLIVEEGITSQVFKNPKNPYSKKLIASIPVI